MTKFIDETGNRYGKLTVIKRNGSSKDHKAMWLCKCDCGNYTTTTGKSLRNGSCTSCGCHRKDVLKRGMLANKTHGETNCRLYNIWRGIKKRCRLKTDKSYKYYGLKGIDVCDEWYDSYECFRDWSLKHGYNEKLTLDRIDFYGNYTPDNCRWVDYKTQENNRRNTVYVEYEGKTYPRAILADKLGVSNQALLYRQKHGIPLTRKFLKFVKAEDLMEER